MKFYSSTLFLTLVVLLNCFVVSYAFMALSAPSDLRFMLGVIAISALVLADINYAIFKFKS